MYIVKIYKRGVSKAIYKMYTDDEFWIYVYKPEAHKSSTGKLWKKRDVELPDNASSHT